MIVIREHLLELFQELELIVPVRYSLNLLSVNLVSIRDHDYRIRERTTTYMAYRSGFNAQPGHELLLPCRNLRNEHLSNLLVRNVCPET